MWDDVDELEDWLGGLERDEALRAYRVFVEAMIKPASNIASLRATLVKMRKGAFRTGEPSALTCRIFAMLEAVQDLSAVPAAIEEAFRDAR